MKSAGASSESDEHFTLYISLYILTYLVSCAIFTRIINISLALDITLPDSHLRHKLVVAQRAVRELQAAGQAQLGLRGAPLRRQHVARDQHRRRPAARPRAQVSATRCGLQAIAET